MTRPTPAEVALAESVITAAGGHELSLDQMLQIRFAALTHAATLAEARVRSGYAGETTNRHAVVEAATSFESFLCGKPSAQEETRG